MSLCSLTRGHLVQTRSSLWIKRASNSRDQNLRQTQCCGESTTTRGRKGPRLSFSFIFKNQFCLAVYQSVLQCSAGETHCFPFIAHQSCPGGVLLPLKSFLSPSLCAWGRGMRVLASLPLHFSVTVGQSHPHACALTHVVTLRQRMLEQSSAQGSGHAAAHRTFSGEPPFANSPSLEEPERASSSLANKKPLCRGWLQVYVCSL